MINKTRKILTILITVFMIINIIITTLATVRYSDRANKTETTNAVFRAIDKIYTDEYMKNKFPKLKIIKK